MSTAANPLARPTPGYNPHPAVTSSGTPPPRSGAIAPGQQGPLPPQQGTTQGTSNGTAPNTSYGAYQGQLNSYYNAPLATQVNSQNTLVGAANQGMATPQQAASAGYNPAAFQGGGGNLAGGNGAWNYGNVQQMVGGLMPGDPGYNALQGQQSNLAAWNAGPGSAQTLAMNGMSSVNNSMLNGGAAGGYSQSQIYQNGANAQSNNQLNGTANGFGNSPTNGLLPTQNAGPMPAPGAMFGGYNNWGNTQEGNPYSYMTGQSSNGLGGATTPVNQATYAADQNPLTATGNMSGLAQLLNQLGFTTGSTTTTPTSQPQLSPSAGYGATGNQNQYFV